MTHAALVVLLGAILFLRGTLTGAAVPLAQPTEQGQVAFSDTFASPNSGWSQQATASWRVGYEGGEYVVAKQAGAGGAPFGMRADRFGDFIVSVWGRLVAPTPGAFLVLHFRRQDNGDRYTVFVNPTDSTFQLTRVQDGLRTILIDWTSSNALNRGSQPNLIGVRALGSDITVLLNRQQAGYIRDDGLRDGVLALGVGERDDGPAEAHYTDMTVYRLGGPPSGHILFRDDFASAGSSWTVWPPELRDPSRRLAGYDSGEFYLIKPPGQYVSSTIYRRQYFDDAIIEIDTRLLTDDPRAFTRLDFRRQPARPDTNYYSFQIFPNDGSFSLIRSDFADGAGRWTNLLERTPAAAINRGDAPNRIGVLAQGSRIVLLINGQAVGHVTDETYRDGFVELAVSASRDAQAEARFSNLIVSSTN